MTALQASGAISLGQLQSEFGGSNPVGLSEYYRGGSEVPDTGATINIPQSGAISLGNFYGTQDTQYRNIAFDMRYDTNAGTNGRWSGTGLTTQSSLGTPSSLSGTDTSYIYQPVFRAGTNFVTSLTFTIHQNEDCSSNTGHVILYGGTADNNVTNVVYRWDAGTSGSTGGNRNYTLSFNANGSISGIQYNSGNYNTGIITLAVQSVDSDHRWYGFAAHRPDSIGKQSEIIDGLEGLTNVLQPD